ncbi:MAG: hypothetical protein IJR53_07260 [Bacteroidales bacterium]|nr:hypothetical protein [Bacteroidales bacterium]
MDTIFAAGAILGLPKVEKFSWTLVLAFSFLSSEQFDSLHKIEALLHDGETDDDGETHGDDGKPHGDDGKSHDDDGESHGVETTHALSLPSKPSKPSKPLIPLIPLIPLTPCHR